MTKEELFFKENYPEYVTEKGECLSPYWDLFSAGVICDTFECKVKIEQLEKENAELKRDKEDLLFIRDQRAKCMCEDKEQLTYAKTIIQDLLDNTDEYARQRAEDFLKESE